MKILIVDDHALFRAGLKLLLARLADDITVFEAETAEAGLVCCSAQPDIDLILLDLNLPDIFGLDGLANFRRSMPATAIVLLTGATGADLALEGRMRGAQGFIAKSIDAEQMLDALRRVLDGELYFPAAASISNAPHLTPRQVEVLKLLCQGRSNKEIARDLGMSDNTVRTHLAAIFREMQATSRTEVAMAARRFGLV